MNYFSLRGNRRGRRTAGPIYDRGVAAGIGVCLALLVAGVIFGGSQGSFLSPVSLALVLGGVAGATLIHFSQSDLRAASAAFGQIIIERDYNPLARIRYLVDLAQAVRKEGLLVLEQESRRTQDAFLRVGLELAVDAKDAEDIRRILGTEIRMSNDRSARAVQVFETMGTYAPAMGLIGTLVGLIQMLGSLQDPAAVGPAMALALVTTLYGAVLANMVFLPIAGKLRNRAEEEAVLKSITLEGVVSLSKQESPIAVEQRLQTFSPLASAA